MAFDAAGHCIVSNQDDDMVTQLNLKTPPIDRRANRVYANAYFNLPR